MADAGIDREGAALRLSGRELAGMLGMVTELLARLTDEFPRLPACDSTDRDAFLADPAMRRLPGETGRPLAELLAVVERAGRIGVRVPGGKSFAYIPGSGLAVAAVADLISGVLNCYTGVSFGAPAMVALEQDVLRWLIELMGFPAQAGGILTTGASLATLSALVSARAAHFGNRDFGAGRIYFSDQAHHCVGKAARIAGFRDEQLRAVPVDRRQRMDLAALRAAIDADRARGCLPFCIVANAGTTNTGAIDPLADLADIARDERLWLHVDAAYGGFFRLTARGRERLAGIERADSIALDPHKALFLPFGTGCLLVRDRDLLGQAHAEGQVTYLRDLGGDRLADFSALSPELTRPHRGLRLWLALHLHGVAAFRDALDEKLDLAAHAWQSLRAMPGLEVYEPPELSIASFRCARPGADPAAENRATEALVNGVNARGNALLSTTRIGEHVVARIAVLSAFTTSGIVAQALADIRAEAEALAAGPGDRACATTCA